MRGDHRFRAALAVLTALGSIGAPSSAAEPPGCASDRSHEFDFWIGDWQVFTDGKLAGTNSIQPILDGCVLQESWSGAEGSAGSSFNFYNPQTKKWQQFWVWRNGQTLALEGGFDNGKMTLEGESLSREGQTIQNRIVWFDNPDGTVRQLWEISRDGGKSWQSVFDGLYKKESLISP